MRLPKQEPVPMPEEPFADMPDNGELGMGQMEQVPQDMGDGSQNVPNGGEDQELLNIISSLDDDSKKAVKKYAESMSEKSEGQNQNQSQQPQMESVNNDVDSIVTEITSSLFDDGKPTFKRSERKITNKEIGRDNPFISRR